MEKMEPTNLEKGAWDNIETGEKKEAIKFEIGKPVIVTMQTDKPREILWETGVFYIFDVLQNNEEKVIKTSAWTLLRGLKQHEPLKEKTLKIEKKMVLGKQTFSVEVDKPQEESV